MIHRDKEFETAGGRPVQMSPALRPMEPRRESPPLVSSLVSAPVVGRPIEREARDAT
jgi:hypothetical protein